MDEILNISSDAEGGNGRKTESSKRKSLVRPDRARLDHNHPQYHYAQRTVRQGSLMNVQPSMTGNDPHLQEFDETIPLDDMRSCHSNYSQGIGKEIQQPYHDDPSYQDNRDSCSVLETQNDSPCARKIDQENKHSQMEQQDQTRKIEYSRNPFKPIEENNLITIDKDALLNSKLLASMADKKNENVKLDGPPPSMWRLYCYIITFWAPSIIMRLFGMKKRDRQMAWREKIGLISIILYIAALVAFLTFGFTQTVCDNSIIRIKNDMINEGYLIIHGRAYELTLSKHPAAYGVPENSNVLYPPVNAGGKDASFLFQNVNDNCLNVLTPTSNSSIPTDGNKLAYYMPCKVISPDGSSKPNFTTEYYEGWACHTSSVARDAYWNLKVSGEVFYTWDEVLHSSRNLVVFNGNILDLDLIEWINTDSVNVPNRFYELKNDETLKGIDVSQKFSFGQDRRIAKCLTDIAKVGYIDSEQIGCIASKIVLYVSLVFIVGIVAIKFFFAVYFKWIVAGKLEANYMNRKDLAKRENEIEEWSNNIYDQGPVKNVAQVQPYNHKKSSVFRPRATQTLGNQTMSSQLPYPSSSKWSGTLSYYQDNITSRTSLFSPDDPHQSSIYLGTSQGEDSTFLESGTDINTGDYTVPQPPINYQPFGYPLAHTICLITAYSESIDGLRTTLDSVATTIYPNSHKLILIICDGLVKGSGNDLTTPEIVISMMKDFSQPPETVQPYSYVSVVSGSKRHNMAKVYAGFYKYDDNTMNPTKQQRVPMIAIVKCGTPSEHKAAKPGNRGKRDSQIILMSFLQRVMFDERMTELEYELFNGIWKITGIAPDFYEIVLMVDADTKVFPDSITHMVACMVKDPEIMGLCGETKIANKRDTWVSMIQVFEYYISHHQSKAFESIFGGVTCLPGCFCMYRIKTPKGEEGYWVPILANPDIVERYAENVVNTLHKKNLLLLGEDRFLSTLMLRTFPKRKQIFVPKAVCKTIVPTEFKVLLSQRRRWINSTVHNLMELVLVRDLCGVFCISMQFVVFIELVGTLVLPAAISFTLYVIIISIVKKPTPILSLILLALILGIPGVLIVVTASRWSYILWMFIYLFSLPIWNFVLPMNAYWRFDDFSWGDTRTIAGGDNGGHDDAEGEFDSSKIVMKRWRDFEREKHRFMASHQAPIIGG